MTVSENVLYDEKRVEALVASAYRFHDMTYVMLAKDSSPADSLEAAKRILGKDVEFSHLANGYPVYRTTAFPRVSAA